MSTLIINASPHTDTSCDLFLERCRKELIGWNESYNIIDLYNEHFDLESYDTESANFNNIHKYQELVKESDKLVFIYPIIWHNLPVVLNRFIEKVFTNGFAFNDKPYFHKGLLEGKKATVFAYTGAHAFFTRSICKDRAVQHLVKDILDYSAVEAKPFPIGDAMVNNDTLQYKIKAVTEKGIDYLFRKTS